MPSLPYSLDNPYLSPSEKAEVERWFQLPGNVLLVAFLTLAVPFALGLLPAAMLLLTPLALNVLVGLFNWFAYSKHLVGLGYAILGIPLLQWALAASVIIFLWSCPGLVDGKRVGTSSSR